MQASPSLCFEDEHIEVFVRAGTTDYTMITFSPATMKADRKDFWASVIADRMDARAIGIVGKRPNWFPASSVRNAAPVINALTSNTPHRVSYGSSMGGYGAVKFGRLLRLTHTISFAPQLSISPHEVPFDRRFNGDYQSALHEGMAITAEDLAPNNYIFYDPHHALDRRNVDLIAALSPNVIRVPCPRTGHETIITFAGTAKVKALFEQCLNGDIEAIRATALGYSKSSNIRPRIIAQASFAKHPHLARRIFEAHESRYAVTERAVFWHLLAGRLNELGEHDEADELIGRAIELAPQTGDFHQRRSEIFLARDDLPEALVWAKKAIAADPSRAAAYHHLAGLQLRRDALSAAEEAMSQALALSPETQIFLLRMSETLFRRGSLAAALHHAKQALMLAPDDPHVLQHLNKITQAIPAAMPLGVERMASTRIHDHGNRLKPPFPAMATRAYIHLKAWAQAPYALITRRHFVSRLLTLFRGKPVPLKAPGLVLWLDAQDAGSISKVASSVSQWNDKSGQGNHAVQPVGTRQPAYVASAINGKPALRGRQNGTNASQLNIADVSSLDYTDFTLFVVFSRSVSTGTDESIICKYSTGAEFRIRLTGNVVNLTTAGGNSAQTTTTVGLNVPRLMTVRFRAGTDLSLQLNGESAAMSATATAYSLSTSVLELFSQNTAVPFDGHIGEVAFYNRGLSASEIAAMEAYLLARWGIT